MRLKLGLIAVVFLWSVSPGFSIEGLAGRRLLDLDGKVRELGGASAARPFALVFLGTECPISRKYLPRLGEIGREAALAGVELLGVIDDPTLTRERTRAFARDFAVGIPLVFDPERELARELSPTHVPEAFVLKRDGSLLYRGAIDDSFPDLGAERREAHKHFLLEAIRAAIEGRTPAEARTTPVGCLHEPPPGVQASGGTGQVTFTRHVAPILLAHCAGCHREGEVAPFPLVTFADAAKRAGQIATVTERRLMPPWGPEKGHGSFLDDPSLSGSQILTLQAWARAGAPEGDPADLPPLLAPATGWRLGEPDLVLEMPEAFTVPAEGRDIFRCFVLPTGLVEDRVVSAIEYHPGARGVVHHVLFFLDASGVARKLDRNDAGPGYKTFGGIGFFPSGGLGGYAPGSEPRRLSPGLGRSLEKGSDLVLQVHYHPTGRQEKDRGKVALFFAKEPVEHLVTGLVVLNPQIDIPAGEKRYERTASYTLPVAATVIGAAPHMHYLGKRMRVQATTPSGEIVPLISINSWDFRWQGQYLYREPIRLEKGTRIDLEAVYDNSAENPRNPSQPPRRVTSGEQSTDEMCMAFFQVYTQSEEDRQALRRATLWNLFRATRS